MDPLPIAAAALATGALVAGAVPRVLRWLPEPVEGHGKTPYADLGTPAFLLGCGLASCTAQAISLVALPLRVQPLWTVLAVCGVLLAAIDARTTWLPLRLTRIGWSVMVGALATTALLGAPLPALLRTAAGAGLAGLFYLVVWALTRGGLGYGDVRFAPLLGAATAAASWELLLWGILLGTVVGALHGTVLLLARRRGSFPYAPSMLAGPYLAALALHLVPGVST